MAVADYASLTFPPLQKQRSEGSVEEYIANRTARAPNGCLIWRGAAVNRTGWFQFKGYRLKSNSAPTCVYNVRLGPVPVGRILRHSCDDPRCVEISHLIPGKGEPAGFHGAPSYGDGTMPEGGKDSDGWREKEMGQYGCATAGAIYKDEVRSAKKEVS